MTISRITSYNVCYTKLLRICAKISAGMEKNMKLIKGISVKIKLLTAFISVSALLIVIGIVAGLGFQNMDVITSYSIHYTKLYE